MKERLEKERYGGYTKEEAEAMESDYANYNESIKESGHTEEDIRRTESDASRIAQGEILRTEGEAEFEKETFNEAVKFFEEKVKTPVKPTLKADKTTALFDTKDSRTGEEIKANETVYHLTDTDETVYIWEYYVGSSYMAESDSVYYSDFQNDKHVNRFYLIFDYKKSLYLWGERKDVYTRKQPTDIDIKLK